MKQVNYTSKSLAFLSKQTKTNVVRIKNKINMYAENPESQRNNIKALHGIMSGYIRLRIGNFRAILDEDYNVITVYDINVRGEIYKGR